MSDQSRWCSPTAGRHIVDVHTVVRTPPASTKYRCSSAVERRSPKPRQRGFNPYHRCQIPGRSRFAFTRIHCPGLSPLWQLNLRPNEIGGCKCDALTPIRPAPVNWRARPASIRMPGSSGPASGRCRHGARSAMRRALNTWRERLRLRQHRLRLSHRRQRNFKIARSRSSASTTKQLSLKCAIACRSATSSLA